MDKLAAYEAILEDHPLWGDGHSKNAAWAPIGATVGARGGAATGYATGRGETGKGRSRRTIVGAALGGSLGLTAGGMADITNSFRRRSAFVDLEAAKNMRENALRSLAVAERQKSNGERIDQVRRKVDALTEDIRSLEDLDRFMTE